MFADVCGPCWSRFIASDTRIAWPNIRNPSLLYSNRGWQLAEEGIDSSHAGRCKRYRPRASRELPARATESSRSTRNGGWMSPPSLPLGDFAGVFTLMHPSEMLVVHGPQESLLFKSVSGQVEFYGWTSRAMRGKKFVLRDGINHQFGLFH